MRPAILRLLPLLFAVTLEGQIHCTDLGADKQPKPHSVNHSVYASCSNGQPVQVRLFDQNGNFLKIVNVPRPGEPGEREVTFYPEQRFAALPDSHCVQGDALRDAAGTCVGRFDFACAAAKTAPIDVEIHTNVKFEVDVTRQLKATRTRAGRPLLCSQRSPEPLFNGDAIERIIAGEAVRVTVRRPGKPTFSYMVNLKRIHGHKTDQPTSSEITVTDRTSGQSGGGISQTEAQIAADSIRFRLKGGK